jgi:hypothetical protein
LGGKIDIATGDLLVENSENLSDQIEPIGAMETDLVDSDDEALGSEDDKREFDSVATNDNFLIIYPTHEGKLNKNLEN